VSSPRVVVFGGSGFIGTRLVARLVADGCDVRIADIVCSSEYPEFYVPCDVRNFADVAAACRDRDVIYNLAAEHVDDLQPRDLYYQTNVDGAQNLCRAAEAHGIRRVVFTSSVAIYGLPDRETDETGAAAPFNDYGKSKLQAEEVHRRWFRAAEDRCLVIVRPTVVFGEGNHHNFYALVKQLATGRFLMVGNGRNRKSIAYVENVAAFLQFALRFERGEHTFNYVDKPDFDMNTLVPMLREMLGRRARVGLRLPYWLGYGFGLACDAFAWITKKRLPISAVRVKKFCGSTQFSAQKALAAGFEPPCTLEQGLDETIRAEFPSARVRRNRNSDSSKENGVSSSSRTSQATS